MKAISVHIFISLLVLTIFLSFHTVQANENGADSCPSNHAIYKPHPSYPTRNLDFTLTIEKPYPEGWQRDFYIHAYDRKTGKEVSALRNSMFSLISADYRAFNFIALRKDFFPEKDILGKAPYVFILQDTNRLKIEPVQAEKDKKEPEDLEIKNPPSDLSDLYFYTDQKILPDFRGLDVWVFEECEAN